MSPDSYDIKAKIGVVFQDVAVFEELTVYENIDYFCGLYIKDKKLRKQYINEAIELVGLKDNDKNFLKARKNGLFLTDNQVSTLNRYNIDTDKCGSMSELLYMIDQIDDDDEELNYLADQIAEANYYQNTRK